ncbi:hypothetical protein [Aerosakkonema funiforme]|nr:hypothetical protein [Aerosakkonema funiforme]
MTFEQLSIAQEGNTTLIRLTNSNNEIIVSLIGGQAANINAADFVIR